MTIHTPHIATKSGLTRVRALPPIAEAARRRTHGRSSELLEAPCIAAENIRRELSGLTAPSYVPHQSFTPRLNTPPKKASDGTEAVKHRMIFIAAFGVFLFATVFERALRPLGLSRPSVESASKSVFEQARESAHISAAYAFMG